MPVTQPIVVHGAIGPGLAVPDGAATVGSEPRLWPWLLVGALVAVLIGFVLCAVLVSFFLSAEPEDRIMQIPFVQRWLRARIPGSPDGTHAAAGPLPVPHPLNPSTSVPDSRRAYVSADAAAVSTRPGVAADARQSEHLSLIAVSVVGEGHVVERITREDAYAAAVDGHGCWVLAVADGVSGSSNSHLAADAAVNLAVGTVDGQTVWQDVPGILARQLPGAIDMGYSGGALERRLVGDKQVPGSTVPKATLTMARAVRGADGRLHVDLAAVGNSSVLSISPAGPVVELMQLRERNDGTTEALPSRDPAWHTGQVTLSAAECLVLCSDGFERLFAENEDRFRQIIFGTDPAWDRLSALVELMTRPAQGESDDRTVAVLRSEAVPA